LKQALQVNEDKAAVLATTITELDEEISILEGTYKAPSTCPSSPPVSLSSALEALRAAFCGCVDRSVVPDGVDVDRLFGTLSTVVGNITSAAEAANVTPSAPTKTHYGTPICSKAGEEAQYVKRKTNADEVEPLTDDAPKWPDVNPMIKDFEKAEAEAKRHKANAETVSGVFRVEPPPKLPS
jgi:hypothetical protein